MLVQNLELFVCTLLLHFSANYLIQAVWTTIEQHDHHCGELLFVRFRFLKNGFAPLHLTSSVGLPEIATVLLNNGANANARAKNGLTPMHLCAQEDKVEVAEILEQHGAEIDPQTKVRGSLQESPIGNCFPFIVRSHILILQQSFQTFST